MRNEIVVRKLEVLVERGRGVEDGGTWKPGGTRTEVKPDVDAMEKFHAPRRSAEAADERAQYLKKFRLIFIFVS